MAKRRNVFSDIPAKDLKKELKSNVAYLESIDVGNIEDEIDWKITAKGVMPTVVTTIEAVIQTVLVVIESSSNMILAIYEKEGGSPDTERILFTIINTLDSIQAYYDERTNEIITHRRLSKKIGQDKKGQDKMIHFLVATKEAQIKARTIIVERVLKIKPIIIDIEAIRTVVNVKGGKEVPESMLADSNDITTNRRS